MYPVTIDITYTTCYDGEYETNNELFFTFAKNLREVAEKVEDYFADTVDEVKITFYAENELVHINRDFVKMLEEEI